MYITIIIQKHMLANINVSLQTPIYVILSLSNDQTKSDEI